MIALYRLKDSTVSLMGIRPQIAIAIPLAAAVVVDHGAAEMVITSGSEESAGHSRTSLHWDGAAIDIRSRELPDTEAKRAVVSELRRRLGLDFDVILEDLGGPREHFHLEWQPKRRGRDGRPS